MWNLLGMRDSWCNCVKGMAAKDHVDVLAANIYLQVCKGNAIDTSNMQRRSSTVDSALVEQLRDALKRNEIPYDDSTWTNMNASMDYVSMMSVLPARMI